MKLPLQITYRNMESSEAVEDNINKWAEKLERICDSIMRCRVRVEAPSQRKRQGGHYHTRIDITLPGGDIAVNREPSQHHSYVDVYVSIRDAFENAERQLEEYVRRRKGHVKTHEAEPRAWVEVLVPEEDYGRIMTSDGRDIYFHRNSILNAEFDKLTVGAEVRFIEQQGDKGPQASSVRIVGKQASP